MVLLLLTETPLKIKNFCYPKSDIGICQTIENVFYKHENKIEALSGFHIYESAILGGIGMDNLLSVTDNLEWTKTSYSTAENDTLCWLENMEDPLLLYFKKKEAVQGIYHWYHFIKTFIYDLKKIGFWLTFDNQYFDNDSFNKHVRFEGSIKYQDLTPNDLLSIEKDKIRLIVLDQ